MAITKTKQGIFNAVVRERNYQDGKWGTIHDHPHTVLEWIDIMKKELQEAKQSPANEMMLEEVLQVIAVGFACLEQHGVIERELAD